MKITKTGRIALIGLGLIGIGVSFKLGYFQKAMNNLAPKSKISSNVDKEAMKEFKKVSGMDRPLRVGTNTWPGFAPGQYFNGGFKASKDSRYFKEYGILVEFVNNDNFTAGREQWKAGDVDLLWTTADSYVMDAESYAEYQPVGIFQVDWSFGGDAIVVARGINSVNDLANGENSVAVAIGTPSYTLLTYLLQSAGKTLADVNIVKVESAPDAAAMYIAGKVKAAVLWNPDDSKCVAEVPGTSILIDTKKASNIIADMFFVKKSFLDSHPKEIHDLVEGWFKGVKELNESPEAKKQAAQILAANFNGVSVADAEAMLENVKFSTYGDNLNFFGLNRSYKGIRGSELYNKMASVYVNDGIVKNPPAWSNVINTSVLNSITLSGPGFNEEGVVHFEKLSDQQALSNKEIAKKHVSITFASGSYALDDNALTTIDEQFVEQAKAFGHSRIRIEGNTDNVGSEAMNKILSNKRAKAVVDYLVKQYNFDPNRFNTVGNGSLKPIPGMSNDTPLGRAKNRRTDFIFID